MTTTTNLSLFQTLLLVLACQCCAEVAAVFDHVKVAANPINGIVSTTSQQHRPPAPPLPLGIGTLANSHGRVAINSTKAAVDLKGNGNGNAVFDVKKYGAKANGKSDDAQAFMTTWIAACRNTTGPAKFLIPKGTFLVGPVVFAGPCQSRPITIEIQGTVKATTDISEYSSPDWISIEGITGLILTGSGVFDGQGASAWPYNDCKTNNNCQILPNSIKFTRLNHSIVDGLTSINSKGFHTSVFRCYNFTATNMNIIAPGNSPNTDGMHLSTSKLVTISSSTIGTGDDCVSIGHSCEKITVTNVTCGPGHGISIGSLGRYKTEKSVLDVLVQNCTIFNATNGARIKTWADTISGSAVGIIFDNIVMRKVKNPIIIDQTYGTKKKKASKWKISNVLFKNIRGTSTTNVAVLLECSELFPCEGVELRDINLSYGGASLKNTTIVSSCLNAKIRTFGVQNPPACVV
ncbi:exopolygalacturonase-like [Cucurbita moschata]|uniref:Exopolygalacturonase-like n=1 Tax=Cucurbita moschata TaxID=3662 RepID=A0A6J1GQZ3_CUCMO|nr:exopolygalacturonase-like [Cucurbita moschata]